MAVLDLQPQVSEGGRLLFGAERCRETAVRLDHGVGDVPGVEDILAPQGLHQVGCGQPEGAQSILVDLSIQNDRLGAAGHQIEKFLAAKAQR